MILDELYFINKPKNMIVHVDKKEILLVEYKKQHSIYC